MGVEFTPLVYYCTFLMKKNKIVGSLLCSCIIMLMLAALGPQLDTHLRVYLHWRSWSKVKLYLSIIVQAQFCNAPNDAQISVGQNGLFCTVHDIDTNDHLHKFLDIIRNKHMLIEEENNSVKTLKEFLDCKDGIWFVNHSREEVDVIIKGIIC